MVCDVLCHHRWCSDTDESSGGGGEEEGGLGRALGAEAPMPLPLPEEQLLATSPYLGVPCSVGSAEGAGLPPWSVSAPLWDLVALPKRFDELCD